MKKIFAFLLIMMGVNTVSAQKLYVWKPKSQVVNPRPFYTEKDTIDVVIYDGRIFTKKSKIECTTEEVIEELRNVVKQAYNKATIRFLETSDYNKKAVVNHATIKIGIAAFHAGFGTDVSVGLGSVGGNFSYGVFPKGMWNAITSFYVRIYDKREGRERTSEKTISHTESKSNMGGYATAKKALNNTFVTAISEMLLTIDNGLMEE